MAKIDKVKELIGFYKLVFAIMIGFFASSISIIISGDSEKKSLFYTLSIPFSVALFLGIMVIIALIAKEIKKLEDL